MDVDGVLGEGHTHEVHPVGTELGRQGAHLPEFGLGEAFVDPKPSAHGSDFDDDSLPAAPGDEIHLSTADDKVAVEDLDTPAGEDRLRHTLAPPTEFPPLIRHGRTTT